MGKCRSPNCARSSNASPELHNGFCKPCWAKYQQQYEAAVQAERTALLQQAATKGDKAYAAVAAAKAGAKDSRAATATGKAAIPQGNAAALGKQSAVLDTKARKLPGAAPGRSAAAAAGSGAGQAHAGPQSNTRQEGIRVQRGSTPPATHQLLGAPQAPAANARGNGPAANTRAAAKDKIPTAVRNQVWLKYMGNTAFGPCPCCGIHDISLVQSGGFECGHVQAEAQGGSTNLSNLIPVCKSCNLGMGTTNMIDYVKQYYPHRHQVLTAHHTAVITSLMGQMRL